LNQEDPRYKAVKERDAKEDIFYDYIEELKEKKEKEKEEKKSAFLELLKNTPAITQSTKFKTVEQLFEKNENFQSLKDKSREEIFNQYLKELKDKAKSKEETERKDVEAAFNTLLKETLKTAVWPPTWHTKTPFSQILPLINSDARYSALKEFSSKVKDDKKDEEGRRSKKKKSEASVEEYAKKLYEKFNEELDESLREDRRGLKFIMENAKCKVTPTDTKETLTKKCTELLLSTFKADNLHLLFAEMIDHVKNKKDQEQKDKEKEKEKSAKHKRKHKRSSSGSGSESESESDSDSESRKKKEEESKTFLFLIVLSKKT